MAEEHGVFGPALLGAELFSRASILCCHQLLGRGVAVDAGVTVFPPVFRQLVPKEELTAWVEGEERLYVTIHSYRFRTQVCCLNVARVQTLEII